MFSLIPNAIRQVMPINFFPTPAPKPTNFLPWIAGGVGAGLLVAYLIKRRRG